VNLSITHRHRIHKKLRIVSKNAHTSRRQMIFFFLLFFACSSSLFPSFPRSPSSSPFFLLFYLSPCIFSFSVFQSFFFFSPFRCLSLSLNLNLFLFLSFLFSLFSFFSLFFFFFSVYVLSFFKYQWLFLLLFFIIIFSKWFRAVNKIFDSFSLLLFLLNIFFLN